MTDAHTRQPIRVTKTKGAYSFLIVLYEQLADVCRVLDGHGVRYTVDPWISSSGSTTSPMSTIIHLADGTDPDQVQRLLDAA